VNRTLRRWKEHNTVNLLPRAGRRKSITIHEERKLFRAVRKEPKITYVELVKEATLDQKPTTPSRSTIYRSLKKQGLTEM
jgi:hypothetical protein